MNKKFGFQLTADDCFYWAYPSVCEICGECKNLVVDIRLVRRWKLWFRRRR